ncbi:hypothetical protein GCM10022254_37330 [Actinomadura meridiana]|uniref:Uncharacterized protein n=1 Tax=Actinomadura meridiana TaxID=559626 RepID=A0ABP8C608_9ACTN
MFGKAFINEERISVVQENLSRTLLVHFDSTATTVIGGVEVEIRRNSDRASSGQTIGDFTFWPVFVEIEDEESGVTDSIVEITSRVIVGLWEVGIPVVVACDFEDLLPWKGGIERIADPF